MSQRYLRRIDTLRVDARTILPFTNETAVIGNSRECDRHGNLIPPGPMPKVNSYGSVVLPDGTCSEGSLSFGNESNLRNFIRQSNEPQPWMPNYIIEELRENPLGCEVMAAELKLMGIAIPSFIKPPITFNALVDLYKTRRRKDLESYGKKDYDDIEKSLMQAHADAHKFVAAVLKQPAPAPEMDKNTIAANIQSGFEKFGVHKAKNPRKHKKHKKRVFADGKAADQPKGMNRRKRRELFGLPETAVALLNGNPPVAQPKAVEVPLCLSQE